MSKPLLSRNDLARPEFPAVRPQGRQTSPGGSSDHLTRRPAKRTCHCPHSYCICGDHPKFDRPECPHCHGSGEIGFNRSPINDPQCAEEAICNVCHGQGVVTALEAQAYELGWMDEEDTA